MIIGTVREVKNKEYRVGLTPSSVKEYVNINTKFMLKLEQVSLLDLLMKIMLKQVQ